MTITIGSIKNNNEYPVEYLYQNGFWLIWICTCY